MSDFTPMAYALGSLFVLGFLVPLLVFPFFSADDYNHDSFIAPVVRIVEDGFTVGAVEIWGFSLFDGFSLNPFSWLGDTFNEFLVRQLVVFSWLPLYFVIPYLIMVTLAIIYTVIKVLPTT